MNNKTKKWLKFGITGIIVLAWISLLIIINPENIVEKIGFNNIYIIVFFLMTFAGGSSFTAPTAYTFLFAVIAGGTPIIPIIIISGLASSIGDAFYVYFGRRGNSIMTNKTRNRINKFIEKIENKPKIVMPIFIFLYAAFIPMPNDIMTVTLGLAGYRTRQLIIPIILGNIVYFTLLLFLGANAVSLILK